MGDVCLHVNPHLPLAEDHRVHERVEVREIADIERHHRMPLPPWSTRRIRRLMSVVTGSSARRFILIRLKPGWATSARTTRFAGGHLGSSRCASRCDELLRPFVCRYHQVLRYAIASAGGRPEPERWCGSAHHMPPPSGPGAPVSRCGIASGQSQYRRRNR